MSLFAPTLLWSKRFLPRTLFGRTVMILLVPLVLAQTVATFVFYDRHWTTVSNRLAVAVAGEVRLVVDAVTRSSNATEQGAALANIASATDFQIRFEPQAQIAPAKASRGTLAETMLQQALQERLPKNDAPLKFNIDRNAAPEWIGIDVQLPQGALRILCPERRLYTPTSTIFIGWMLGSALTLFAVAIVFLRNQIRPIHRLADAAEAFGRNQEALHFKPEGALEVRRAAVAFLVMRDRIRRQISQRTAMLAGISHDLRTPLTRMKLQLELINSSPATEGLKSAAEGLKSDVQEMQQMCDAYLDFARGEVEERIQQIDLPKLLQEAVQQAARQGRTLQLEAPANINLSARPFALRRCLDNLIGNALRYATHAKLSVEIVGHTVQIHLDDDGPGIAAEQHEQVFKAFTRLDAARSPGSGGVGLGLTIARDIARMHGGDIALNQSAMGGLRASIILPADM